MPMFGSKKHLSRRTFLRGTGAVLALPMLDAMLPALTGQSRTPAPLRFAGVYVPNGALPERWHPATVGKGFELTAMMKALQPSTRTACWTRSHRKRTG
jgi:hypothetical protein